MIALFFYYVFLGCYLLGVAYGSAASVAREKQQQTLEPLLLLPIDRREILIAKLIGTLWRGWPWLALLGVNIVLGTLVGGYHPFSAVLLALAPWPIILLSANMGLLLSIWLGTVLRATMCNLLLLTIPLALGLPFLNAASFSMHGVPERSVGSISYMVLASMSWVLCAGLAFAFWLVARTAFESRAHSLEA